MHRVTFYMDHLAWEAARKLGIPQVADIWNRPEVFRDEALGTFEGLSTATEQYLNGEILRAIFQEGITPFLNNMTEPDVPSGAEVIVSPKDNEVIYIAFGNRVLIVKPESLDAAVLYYDDEDELDLSQEQGVHIEDYYEASYPVIAVMNQGGECLVTQQLPDSRMETVRLDARGNVLETLPDAVIAQHNTFVVTPFGIGVDNVADGTIDYVGRPRVGEIIRSFHGSSDNEGYVINDVSGDLPRLRRVHEDGTINDAYYTIPAGYTPHDVVTFRGNIYIESTEDDTGQLVHIPLTSLQMQTLHTIYVPLVQTAETPASIESEERREKIKQYMDRVPPGWKAYEIATEQMVEVPRDTVERIEVCLRDGKLKLWLVDKERKSYYLDPLAMTDNRNGHVLRTLIELRNEFSDMKFPSEVQSLIDRVHVQSQQTYDIEKALNDTRGEWENWFQSTEATIGEENKRCVVVAMDAVGNSITVSLRSDEVYPEKWNPLTNRVVQDPGTGSWYRVNGAADVFPYIFIVPGHMITDSPSLAGSQDTGHVTIPPRQDAQIIKEEDGTIVLLDQPPDLYAKYKNPDGSVRPESARLHQLRSEVGHEDFFPDQWYEMLPEAVKARPMEVLKQYIFFSSRSMGIHSPEWVAAGFRVLCKIVNVPMDEEIRVFGTDSINIMNGELFARVWGKRRDGSLGDMYLRIRQDNLELSPIDGGVPGIGPVYTEQDGTPVIGRTRWGEGDPKTGQQPSANLARYGDLNTAIVRVPLDWESKTYEQSICDGIIYIEELGIAVAIYYAFPYENPGSGKKELGGAVSYQVVDGQLEIVGYAPGDHYWRMSIGSITHDTQGPAQVRLVCTSKTVAGGGNDMQSQVHLVDPATSHTITHPDSMSGLYANTKTVYDDEGKPIHSAFHTIETPVVLRYPGFLQLSLDQSVNFRDFRKTG